MRVCLITPEYPPMQGGVGDYTSHLVRVLRTQAVEVAVITSNRAASGQQDEPGLSFLGGWGFDIWRRVAAWIREVQPDVLHIQYQTAGYGMHPAINLLPLRLRMLSRHPKIATTFHDLKVPYLFPKAGGLRRWPGALLAGFSDGVVVTNFEDLAEVAEADVANHDELRTRFRRRLLRVIPIGSNILAKPPAGYDRDRWRRDLGVETDEVLLCYFGFLNSTKGIYTLLSAFEGLVEQGKRVKLLMVGGMFGDSDPTNVAYGKRVMEMIEGSNYRDKVLRTGFIDRERVSANLLASDICVLPFDEGASFRHGTLVAAIAHHLPIITTRAPLLASNASLLSRSRLPSLEGSVALVPPRDVRQLKQAIEELMSSEGKRADLRIKVSRIASVFEWDSIAQSTLSLYDSLLSDVKR